MPRYSNSTRWDGVRAGGMAGLCCRAINPKWRSWPNGSAQRDTIVLLEGLSVDDDADGDLRRAAGAVAQALKRKAQDKR